MLRKNGGYHARTKHIDTHVHVIRDCVQKVMISFIFVKTHDQLLDIFTKSLGRTKFEKMCVWIGIERKKMKDGSRR